MEIAVTLLAPSPSDQLSKLVLLFFSQHNIHLLSLQTVNTTCKVPLIFNVTINCCENKSSHMERRQEGQEAAPEPAAWGREAQGYLSRATLGRVLANASVHQTQC